MHEVGVAAEIHRLGREAVAGRGPGRIEGVTVRIGDLSSVEPELLRLAWEAVVAGGPDQGASLEIEWVRARQWCPACRAEKHRSAGSWLRLCPDCDGILAVEGGTEMDLMQVRFEPAEAETPSGDRVAAAAHG
jgi:hydrogenase nickel incorporation protein HypA/HybF